VAVGVLSGCGAIQPPPTVPANLPLRTIDQIFEINWALQKEPDVVRGVGLISYAVQDYEYRIVLAFFGLDDGGRIVSRGLTQVQSPISYAPIPFSVELKPTGRETSFQVKVQHYTRPGGMLIR
jgi:hypothetical protein